MAGALRVDLAANQTGDAIATWNGAGGIVRASRFTLGQGWGTSVPLEVPNDERDSVDALGRGTALWWQETSSRQDLLTNRFE